MASYAELFDIGEDFAAFVGHGLATEQGAVARFRQKLESDGLPSALTERLQRIERRYRLLVAGEMWCPDCQISLAALDFAQRLQPNIELAIISKGRAEDDLRQRLALERIPIPLVLVLDEEFNLLGRFVERPQAVLDGGPQALAAYKAGDYLSTPSATSWRSSKARRAETAPAPASQCREQPAPRPRYCKRCRRPALSR